MVDIDYQSAHRLNLINIMTLKLQSGKKQEAHHNAPKRMEIKMFSASPTTTENGIEKT